MSAVIASPWARVDLNQLYSAADHENLQLVGGEELTLWSFGGQLGNYVNIQKVPPQTRDNHTAMPDLCHLSRDSACSLELKVDMGADEVFPIAGDFEPDEDVDMVDLATFFHQY